MSTPDGLTLARHRDLAGRRNAIWWRRGSLALLALVPALAAINFFGQAPIVDTVSGPEAELTLRAPDRVRGGLLFSARFEIVATQEIKKAILVLDQSWAHEMSINTIEPAPVGETSANGRMSIELGAIPAGEAYILNMQFQANPTNTAWREPQDVDLYDGAKHLLHLDRTITIFP